MTLELYYFPECGFSRSVLNTITNLKIQDQVVLKNIRESAEFENELSQLCGDTKVPTLKVDDKPMRESEAIKAFLVSEFM